MKLPSELLFRIGKQFLDIQANQQTEIIEKLLPALRETVSRQTFPQTVQVASFRKAISSKHLKSINLKKEF